MTFSSPSGDHRCVSTVGKAARENKLLCASIIKESYERRNKSRRYKKISGFWTPRNTRTIRRCVNCKICTARLSARSGKFLRTRANAHQRAEKGSHAFSSENIFALFRINLLPRTSNPLHNRAFARDCTGRLVKRVVERLHQFAYNFDTASRKIA